MYRLLLATIVLPLLLAGCSSESSTEISVGTFLDLGITGLTYETDALEGLLDDGQYEYLAGETVTVKFMGETLFEFDAASGFELSDISAEFLTTADELYSAWYDDDGDESFQILGNLILLLYNLDADANYVNGIDLSELDMNLSVSTEIDLAQPINDFYETTLIELANELGVSREVTPMYAFWNLYDMEGESLPFDLVTNQSYTDDDGTEETYFDNTLEGYFESEANYSTDELKTFSIDYTTDDMGQLTEYVYNFYDNSETIIESETTRQTYNNLGQLEEQLYLEDDDGDGSFNSSNLSSYTYTSFGQLAETVSSNDSDYDSVTDRVYTTTYTYSDDQFLVSKLTINDSNNDGTADSQTYESYEYNTDGIEVLQRTDSDSDGDGSFDDYILKNSDYDDAGSLQSINKSYFDSVTDDKERELIQTYSYHDAGEKSQYEYTTDYDADGDIDYLYIIDYEYDDNGEYTLVTTQIYNDGVTLSKSIRKEYDGTGAGNYRDHTEYTDSDGDGTDESSKTRNYTVNDEGYQTRLVLNIDSDNDSITDETQTTDYTYETFDNGIAALLWDMLAIY
jgi:hypothetical protein